MIIGHGTIAHALTDRSDRTYFASGVSNSRETDERAYDRERNLLINQSEARRLVYFSSLAVFYEDTRYTKHKLEMEALVKKFPKYTIIRLGLAAWGTNPNTLINIVKGQVARGEPYSVWPVFRYVLEEAEFQHWVNLIPEWNCEMNLTGQRMSAKAIIDKYVLGGCP